MEVKKILQEIINISKDAWSEIMKIYNTDFTYTNKADSSPITIADSIANKIIIDHLNKITPKIPIISEENTNIEYNKRKKRKEFWLIDPIDWTKDFIRKNWQFTVNIALIQNWLPTLWVIYLPSFETIYYGTNKYGSFKQVKNQKPKKLVRKENNSNKITILWSRNWTKFNYIQYFRKLNKKYKKIRFLKTWSSIKFCLIAENLADMYIRFPGSHERDVGAWHAIINNAWAKLIQIDTNKTLKYNKPNLKNKSFYIL